MKRIVEERMKKGMSQAELARRIGANQSSLSRIERGKEPPYPLRSIRIARALGWEGDPAELFEEAEPDENASCREEVVRCRDCEHCCTFLQGLMCTVHGSAGWYATKPDGFCHRAVRSES